jgi:hypothetical protein
MIKADFDLNEFINLGLTDGSITAQQVENLKNGLLHPESTQIDPLNGSQIIESIKIDEFAKVLINTCKI